MSVEYDGKNYKVKLKNAPDIKGKIKMLSLKKIGIANIEDIKGLSDVTDIEGLSLRGNKIANISGLSNLTNLKFLDLSYNNIIRIEGLENLRNLIFLNLRQNPIFKWAKKQFGGVKYGQVLQFKNPQLVVDYCAQTKGSQSISPSSPISEKSLTEKETIQKIKQIMKVSDRILIEMMRETLHMEKADFLEKIYDWAENFQFRIDGEYLVINQDTVDDFIKLLDEQFVSWEHKEFDDNFKQ